MARYLLATLKPKSSSDIVHERVRFMSVFTQAKGLERSRRVVGLQSSALWFARRPKPVTAQQSLNVACAKGALHMQEDGVGNSSRDHSKG